MPDKGVLGIKNMGKYVLREKRNGIIQCGLVIWMLVGCGRKYAQGHIRDA